MKDKFRAFVASVILIIYITTFLGVYAKGSVLGTEEVFSGTTEIAKGTYYTQNVFYSDQDDVGNQAEYYIEYTPNKSVSPIISNGNYIYGRHNIYESYDYLKQQGYNPIAGINADFYSLQTGVPISHCVTDGYVVTKDSQPQDAIGFLEDGSAFIGYMGIYLTANKGDESVIIENINKYRQPYSIYLFTDEFGTETYDTSPGLVVVLSDISDKIKVEGTVTATVESVDYYEGSTGIPKDKFVISINDHLKEHDNYKFFESLVPGEEIELKTSLEGDDRFKDALYIMGGSQGRLLNKGVINDKLEKGAAPRTAIGVKEDGSTVFYTVDGRQKGHSYGVQLTTLAKRLRELGCVDAINLDGGGSTTCGIIKPGYSEFEVMNSPSDNAVRKNANFFFLVNNEESTGKADKMYLYPMDMRLLSGAKAQVTAKITDKNFYAVNSSGVDFDVSMGEIDNNGNFIARGTGDFEITASKNGVTSSVTYKVYESPTSILAKVSEKEVSSLTVEPGEKVQITAEAKYKNTKLVSQNNCYGWEVDNDRIGTIEENGLFTAGEIVGSKGEILISAGETTKKIPVTIKGNTDAPEYYHTIDNLNFDGEKISIDVYNEYDVNVDKNGIKMRIDREVVETDFEDGVLSYTCPKDFNENTHRISVEVVNEYDNRSVAFFEIIGKNEPENKFTDISDNWAKNIILYMNKNGVINGYTEDNGDLVFKPQDSMTRAQFAVMISNYLGINTEEYQDVQLPFTDVDALPEWALPQIKAMYSKNIISGRSSDEGVYFDPNTNLSRAEAATILARILPEKLLKTNFEFDDMADIPQWANDGFKVLYKLGAIKGYEDNTIKPLNFVTRAECAKLLYSIF